MADHPARDEQDVDNILPAAAELAGCPTQLAPPGQQPSQHQPLQRASPTGGAPGLLGERRVAILTGTVLTA
jgi:hypothetical protein